MFCVGALRNISFVDVGCAVFKNAKQFAHLGNSDRCQPAPATAQRIVKNQGIAAQSHYYSASPIPGRELVAKGRYHDVFGLCDQGLKTNRLALLVSQQTDR